MERNVADLIKSGDNDSLKRILEKDTSVAEMVTEDGITLLQLALYCRNEEAAEILRGYRTGIDIYEAACTGNLERTTFLLNSSPGLLHSFSRDGFTVLGLASYFGQIDLVSYLLEKGADPNVASDNQVMVAPLHSACAISNYRVAEMLIRYGADVNARQLQGYTPMHSAAHKGSNDIAELLLKNGADINARTDNGKTPLSLAVEADHCGTIKFLREHGGVE
jgi:ankyrin repeat protein